MNGMNPYPRIFSLTFDTDWVPQFILDDILSILRDAGLAGTFFCTGAYAPFPPEMEVGLHPNFLGYGNEERKSEEDVLAGLKSLYPQATGSRSHCYYWHNRLRPLFFAQGLRYDSSQLVPLQPDLRPHTFFGLTRFPVWYSDGVHMWLKAPFDKFSPPGLEDPGLKVLLFHPLHIYLNSRSPGESKELLQGREVFAVTEDLAKNRRSGHGIRTLFLDTLRYINESSIPCRKLCDLL